MHRFTFVRIARALVIASFAAWSLPASAQQGALTFKNFKRYPTGQWSNETTGYRNNVSLGPPHTETTCSGPLDARSAALAKQLGNAAASNCTMQVVNDQERTLEYDQVCTLGPQRQVNHMTMHAIDDRTITVDARSSVPGFGETTTHTKMTYQGPCQAAAATAPHALPGMGPAECAQLPEMRRQIEDGGAQCAGVPEAYRAACSGRMEASRRMVAAMEAQCR